MRMDRFITRTDGKLHVFVFRDIRYIIAKRNYAEIHTTGHKYFVHLTIKSLEEILPDELFCKIHRSYIVALEHIIKIDHNHVYLKEETLLLSSQYYNTLLNHYKVLGEQDLRSPQSMRVSYLKKNRNTG